MSQKVFSQNSDWASRSEKFARQRAQIMQVLTVAGRALDMAELLTEFKLRFRYLPKGFERRMRELEHDLKYVTCNPGAIPTYEIRKNG